MTTLNETRQKLAEVRQAQQDTDIMGVWYALEELADHYEEELQQLTEQETAK